MMLDHDSNIMTPIKSNDLDALDAAFAERVAGFSREDAEAGYKPGEDNSVWAPRFTRSADAVLPWLDKAIYWDSSYCNGQHHVFVNEMRRDVTNRADYGHAAQTFAHAATIALLRAHGVEVEDVA